VKRKRESEGKVCILLLKCDTKRLAVNNKLLHYLLLCSSCCIICYSAAAAICYTAAAVALSDALQQLLPAVALSLQAALYLLLL
jgi:hypothetical protein